MRHIGVQLHACQKSLKILPHTGGFCLRQCSRVNFCSADSSRVRQAIRYSTGCTKKTQTIENNLLLELQCLALS